MFLFLLVARVLGEFVCVYFCSVAQAGKPPQHWLSGLGLLGQKMLKRDSIQHLRTTGPRKYASVAFCLLSASHAVVRRGLNVGQERWNGGGGKVEARR